MESLVFLESPESAVADSELVARLAVGDISTLGELYLRHGGAVRSFLWRLFPKSGADEVDDVCQEVFVTANEAATRFQGGSVKSWLLGIAVRKGHGLQRKRRRRLRLLQEHATQARALSGSQPGSERVLEAREDLNHALCELSPQLREALLLFEVEGFSCAEVAQILDISVSATWTRLRRARSAMRAALGDRHGRQGPGAER